MRRLKIGGLILLMLILMLPLLGGEQRSVNSEQGVSIQAGAMRQAVATAIVPRIDNHATFAHNFPMLAASKPKPVASLSTQDTMNSEAYDPVEVVSPENEKVEDQEGSAHISATVDKTVTLYLIPLLGLILYMIFKKSEQSAWMRLLYKLWDLAKDTDNVFAAGISSRHKSQVDLLGINAAKKQYTLEAANNLISPSDKALANKKAGGLSGALEVALTLFKSAAIIVPAAKQIFK